MKGGRDSVNMKVAPTYALIRPTQVPETSSFLELCHVNFLMNYCKLHLYYYMYVPSQVLSRILYNSVFWNIYAHCNQISSSWCSILLVGDQLSYQNLPSTRRDFLKFSSVMEIVSCRGLCCISFFYVAHTCLALMCWYCTCWIDIPWMWRGHLQAHLAVPGLKDLVIWVLEVGYLWFSNWFLKFKLVLFLEFLCFDIY